MPLPPPADSSVALVTGASSGIGAAIAEELAARGHGVCLVARRAKRLGELAARLAARDGVRAEPIALDLGERSARDELGARLAELGLRVEILVNNAGFGATGSLHRTDHERAAEMVRVNCEAVVDLQARHSPAMAERGRGAVINIASTAAFQPLPGSAAYAATKAFVLSLSEATHAELAPRGVSVTAVCPGPVRTEFGAVAGVGRGERRLPDVLWTPLDAVAREAVDGADRGRRVVVPGALNKAGSLAGRHAPRGLALPLVKSIWRRAT